MEKDRVARGADRRRARLDRRRRRTAARASTSREAGANRADIVAAVTGDDEDNLVICQMAKHHFDVPRTIARVNNPKNEQLFRHLGVDEIISPTRMALGSIEQDIPVHELLHLAALDEGELEIIEAQLQAGSPGGRAGRRATSTMPRGLLAVRRRSATASPTPLRADTVLARGRQGHRDRPAGLRGPAPRAAHRRARTRPNRASGRSTDRPDSGSSPADGRQPCVDDARPEA